MQEFFEMLVLTLAAISQCIKEAAEKAEKAVHRANACATTKWGPRIKFFVFTKDSRIMFKVGYMEKYRD